jgi:hypothetical protein
VCQDGWTALFPAISFNSNFAVIILFSGVEPPVHCEPKRIMSDSCASRKRPFHHVTTDGLTESSLQAESVRPKMSMPSIATLSLEAIFHPKFENENRELQSIRREMKDKVNKKEGYLEVSLKHSGNLLLWSGGQRYCSKNSTDNAFTFCGEVLLRQHFSRAWFQDDEKGEAMYQECSDYVEKNRLTLAFEAVTAVLGQHGDLPNKDFLILTAVASKAAHPRFYTTVELLELAQRFRLPHNDVWVYLDVPKVDQLFVLYDTTRETGLADDTVVALNAVANAHVSSMYPHVDFQGNILEGIVIRYVAYAEGEREHQEQQLKSLEMGSLDILEKVPADMPLCFQLCENSESKVLSVDIRKVFDNCIATGGYTNLTTRLGEAISNVLRESDTVRRTITKQPLKDWDIPKLAKSILEKTDIDDETKRIATLIVKIDQQNAAVRYGVVREDDQRWLCTIHVLHDRTFSKFQKDMKAGDMHLYRGFSIELGTDGAQDVKMSTDVVAQDMQVVDSMNDARLMLKMKFVPYMVRTFCCRNGLQTVSNTGPAGFASYTWKQMKSWGLSEEALAKWQPFFRAWGQYAHECMNNVTRDYIDNSLPPMGEAFYLNHLEHFVPLYENGAIQYRGNDGSEFSGSTYRGMVIVVAIKKETAKPVATFVSQELGGVRLHDDINSLTEEDLVGMQVPKGGGLIVSAAIEEGFGKLRKYTNEYGGDISIILFGCDAESIEASLHPNTRKLVGMVKGWEKTRVAMVKHIALPSRLDTEAAIESMGLDDIHHFRPNDELQKVATDLKKLSDAGPTVDERRGLLVFFPCIPGCGKSALSGAASQDALNGFLKILHEAEASAGPQRELVTLVGDKVKKKYWGQVKKLRSKQPAVILIADKNAPRTAWSTVGDAAGKGLVVPVLPDKRALSTTRIEGIRKSSGEVDRQISHYYPFSLHYLAVCMARVVARPAKSHIGGLDCSLKQACLVLTKFFGLYRNLSADAFMDKLRAMVGSSGSICAARPIELPFFGSGELPDLPQDLTETLTDALQLQYGYELERKDPDSLIAKDPAVQEMESRLRDVIEKHGEMLLGMTISQGVSQSAFVDQVVAHIKALAEEESAIAADEVGTTETSKLPHIKLVSIDVPVQTLHDELKSIASHENNFLEALNSIGANLVDASFDVKGGFEPQTHVTMAHSSGTPQKLLRIKFDSLVGKGVNLLVTGMLWSDRIAALAVELPTTSEDGIAIPESKNEFAHITFWRKGAQAVESNKLPMLVTAGRASEVMFDSPFEIEGTFSFWTPSENLAKVQPRRTTRSMTKM